MAISYLITAILGLAAVVLTSSGEIKAMLLIAAMIVVGAIGFRFIFTHPLPKEEPEQQAPATEENEEDAT